MNEYISQFWHAFLVIITILQLATLKKSLRIFLSVITAVLLILFVLFLPDNVPIEYKIFILLNFLAFFISFLIFKNLWKQSKLTQENESKSHKYRTFVLVSLLICSLVFPINASREIYTIWRIGNIAPEYIKKIFPQMLDQALTNMTSWGSNGKCSYETVYDKEDVKEFYLKLKIQVWGSKCSDGSGWMLIPLPPYDAKKSDFFEFDIKGRSGREIIGISIKDTQFNEVNIGVGIGKFCSNGYITTDWQKCSIPLHEFKNVNFNSIETIGFYVNRELLPDFIELQEVDLASFRFR